MKYKLRYFIDDSETCDYEFEYSHAAKMIIPRVGEYVWLPVKNPMTYDIPEMCCRVHRVEYDTFDDVALVDVYVTDATYEMMEEG